MTQRGFVTIVPVAPAVMAATMCATGSSLPARAERTRQLSFSGIAVDSATMESAMDDEEDEIRRPGKGGCLYSDTSALHSDPQLRKRARGSTEQKVRQRSKDWCHPVRCSSSSNAHVASGTGKCKGDGERTS